MATAITEDRNASHAASIGAPNSEFLDALINEKTAADFCGWSVRTLQAKRTTGTGPRFYRLGRSIRYRRRDLLAFAEDRVRLSTSET